MFNGVLVLEGVTIDDIGWYVCYTNGSKTRVMTGAKLDVDKSLGTNNHIYVFLIKLSYYVGTIIQLFNFNFS